MFFTALGVATLALVAAFVQLDMGRLVAVVADGSGYYLQLARNAASGQGLTFDGLHRSNGFHPLWMGVLIGVFKLVSGSSEFMYRFVGVLAVGLGTAATLLFRRALGTLVSASSAAVGSLVFGAMAVFGANLMESSLLLLALVGLFAVGRRRYVGDGDGGGETVGHALGFGLVLGLTLLARLDAAFLAIVIGLVGLGRIATRTGAGRARSLWLLLCVVLGASVLVVPFLAWNQFAFGSIVPVSGHLESLYPETNLGRLPQTLRELGSTRLAAWGAAIGFLAWFLWVGRRDPRPASDGERYLRGATAVLIGASLVNLGHEVLLMKWQLHWHHAPLVPISGALAAIAWQRHVATGSAPLWRGATIAAVGVFLILCGRGAFKRTRVDADEDWRPRAYEAALWLRKNTAPGERAAMRVAEVTGYFSDRQTVDLLGLAAGVELQNAIRNQRLGGYLDQSQVRYLVQVGDLARADGPQIQASGGEGDVADGRYQTATLRFRSELHRVFSDPITVRKQDEVYRLPAARAENGVVIWKR